MRKGQSTPDKQIENRLTLNQIATVADLEALKYELIEAVHQLLDSDWRKTRIWLKSYEVLELLKISPNKLQELRDKGILPFSKIGGVFYYSQEDIDDMLLKFKKVHCD